MVKNVIVNNDINIKGVLDTFTEADLTRYCKINIPDYDVITEIPKEHMDYINSVKYAVNCRAMFYSCYKLSSLDLSKFNTSKVSDMGVMFSNCRSLAQLDLSNFDTSKVTNMGSMFAVCVNLHTLNLSNFDTSKVTNMIYMFNSCESLTTIKGTLDLSSCIDVYHMFHITPKLRGVHLKNVPRSLIDTDGSLKGADGILNETYIIDNILEDK